MVQKPRHDERYIRSSGGAATRKETISLITVLNWKEVLKKRVFY